MDGVALNADLIDDLARQRVVLFLGSGVTASAVTNSGNRIRQWEPFLRHCAEQVVDGEGKALVKRLLNDKDFLIACEILRRRLGDRWGQLLHDEFAQIATPSSLHRALLNLGQRIMVTTNFDKIIESAFEQSGSSHYPKIVTKLGPDAFKMLRDEERYLVKMHGTIDDSDSFIFTKSEYIERAIENWVYAEFLRILLATYTVVFVGFSMADPAISSLVEQYAFRYPRGRPHYILQAGPTDPDIAEINKSLRKLFVIEYDSANNHEQLVSVIEAMVGRMNSWRAELAAASLKDGRFQGPGATGSVHGAERGLGES